MTTKRRTIVYRVHCKPEGKSYIGCTVAKLTQRRAKHYYDVRKGTNQPLQQALRKYREDDFEWTILEEFEIYEEALEAEVRYIKELGTLRPNGFNVKEGGEYSSSLGSTWTEERREEHCRQRSGTTWSEEHRVNNAKGWTPEKRLSAVKRNQDYWTPERRAEHSKMLKNIHARRKALKCDD